MSARLLVGTRKGLFAVGEGGVEAEYLKGWQVYHAAVAEGGVHAATNNWVYGAAVHRSADGGATWERSESLGLPEESGLKLNATWHVEPGRDVLWLGGDPGVLFRSPDEGATWEPVPGVVAHPTRERWNPGAGGMCCHSITLDPDDPRRLWIGISAAGVFRSDDGGETWAPANKGTAADFMPDDPFPELGQCVHKVLAHPRGGGRLWQQNHCGVYRSDDGGESWERLESNGLPSGFGFPLALDPDDPGVAYVVPEEGSDNRVTSGGRLGVYRTADGGASWELHADGLPERAWISVKREGMACDADGVYLGTQQGSVYALDRERGRWRELARDLPEILSVEPWPS